MKTTKYLFLLLALVLNSTIIAQEYNLYHNLNYQYKLLKSLDSAKNFHSSIRPYLYSDVTRFVNIDSLQLKKKKEFKNQKHLKLKNKIFNDHLINIQEDIFKVHIDPLMNFEAGRDSKENATTWVNTRGFQIMGSIGKKFSFYTNFYENQASFPAYVKQEIQRTRVVPGQGKVRNYGEGYDYSKASGYISYTPSKYFNIQFGTGKHFLGDGYRSLLLSDNAFNYPFLKITTTVWKIKYMNLFAQFQDLMTEHSTDLGYNKKYAAIHYLSFNVTKRLNVGLFEAILFEARDTTANRGFEVAYLNPVIFLRPVEFSVGSPDNALMGLNFSYLVGTKNKIYGQFILDEFKLKEVTSGDGWWANKFGYQIGFKSYDFMKTKNLYIQMEYNRVRPYTYSHWTTLQNYGHYNQPLAHPLGANFAEFLTIIRYHRERLYLNYKFIYAKYGENIGDQNYGKDIFLSYRTHVQDYNNEIGQGRTTKLYYNNLELSYLINPSYNLNFVLGFTSRIADNDLGKDNTTHIYIGLRTSIDNFYFDF